MKAVTLAIVLTSLSVHAEPPASPPLTELNLILGSRETLLATFEDPVTVGALVFVDEACNRRFGHPGKVAGADRAELAGCLFALELHSSYDKVDAIVGRYLDGDVLIGVTRRRGKIATLGAAAAQPGDAAWPTLLVPPTSEFKPSRWVQAAIKKLPDGAHAIFKLCQDEHAVITSQRLVRSSGMKDFDAQAATFVRERKQVRPFLRDRKACAIVPVGVPDESGIDGLIGIPGGVTCCDK